MSDTGTDTVRLLARLTQQSERMGVDSALGMPVIRLGLITTLYFRNGHTPEMKRRVEACFSRFYEAFKTRLKWQLFKRMRRLSGSGFCVHPASGCRKPARRAVHLVDRQRKRRLKSPCTACL